MYTFDSSSLIIFTMFLVEMISVNNDACYPWVAGAITKMGDDITTKMAIRVPLPTNLCHKLFLARTQICTMDIKLAASAQ